MNYLSEYLKEEDLETKLTKQAAMKAKRLERSHRLDGKDDF